MIYKLNVNINDYIKHDGHMDLHITKKLLLFSGYGLKYEINDEREESINIDAILEENGENISNGSIKRSVNEIIFGYVYNIVIFFLITWSNVYAIGLSIKTEDTMYIYRSVFQMLISIQYILGIKYFNRTIFYERLLKHTDIIKNVNVSFIISVCFSFLISVGCMVLTLMDKPMFIYDDIYNDTDKTFDKMMLMVLLILDKTLSYSTFCMNVIAFVMNMFYHKNKLERYRDTTINFSNDSSLSLTYKINSITLQYSRLKAEYIITIESLNSMFVVMNIFGLTYLYVVLNLIEIKSIEITEIIDIVLLLISIYAYIYSATKVRSALDDIVDMITSPAYINNCIRKDTNEKIIPNINENITNQEIGNLISHTYITTVESSEMLSWFALYNLMKDKWTTFQIFGLIELSDQSIFQKIFGILFLIILSQNILDVLTF